MDQAGYYIHKDYKEPKKNKFNAIVLLFIALMVVVILIDIAIQLLPNEKSSLSDITGYASNIPTDEGNNTANESNAKPLDKQVPLKAIRKYNPVKLNQSDVLVSFRIDDITFNKSQKPVLENALYLAKKYDITFDLGVIASQFVQLKDNDTYQIYLDNQDVFEVAAHGLDDKKPVDNSFIKSEFAGVDKDIQEVHIKLMKEIFEENDLIWATKILITPDNKGNFNTIKIAKNNGYRLIAQEPVSNRSYIMEIMDGTIIATKSWILVKESKDLYLDDVTTNNQMLSDLINKDQAKYIQIATNPINYEDTQAVKSTEALINQMKNNPNSNQIKFGMISDRFFN